MHCLFVVGRAMAANALKQALRVALVIALPLALGAQPPAKKATAKKNDSSKTTKAAKPAKSATLTVGDSVLPAKKLKVPPFFRSEAPLAVTLTTNIRQLRKDKGDKAPWHAATVATTDSTGKPVVVSTTARTRGIWRLKNCDFPPTRLKFVNKHTKGTIFHDLDEPKLVSYCRNSDIYEQYILQEFQLYRVYRLLTPLSHQVRLVQMTYVDSANAKVEAKRYGFLMEDPAQVAARFGGMMLKQTGAGADDLDPKHAAMAFVFEYMIGNTDFSFSGLHNTELVQIATGEILPVVYDFDYAGAVDASYATADPIMRSARVRDRQFRGFCSLKTSYVAVLELFKAQKNAIYALYADEIGRLMTPRTVKSTLSYFDDFYRDIATPRDFEKRVLGDCVGDR